MAHLVLAVKGGGVEIEPAFDGLTQRAKLVGTNRIGDDGASIRFHKVGAGGGWARAPVCGLTYITTGRFWILLAH